MTTQSTVSAVREVFSQYKIWMFFTDNNIFDN